MSTLVSSSQFAELLRNGTPLLDVRSPSEFAAGAFPNSENIPLLDDSQRAAVGTIYKKKGKQAAIDLGNELLNGQEKQRRLDQWQGFIQLNPNAHLYCYRGGLRSQIVQQWLAEAGVEVERIEGGYKAMRNFLIDSIDEQAQDHRFVIVAGKTGCSKTHLLKELSSKIDLEGIARHRGSAFGKRATGQPAQINFENQIAIELLQQSNTQSEVLFLEDESRAIGSLSIPVSLHSKMAESSIAVIEEPIEYRINTILNDYILDNYKEYKKLHPDSFEEIFEEFLTSSLERIKKRLGGENYQLIKSIMSDALQAQRQSGDIEGHRKWIGTLLTDYYDPMYDYQLGKKLNRVVFRGSSSEFLSWAAKIDQAGLANLKT